MDPFERFESLKPKILADEEFMGRLRNYSTSDYSTLRLGRFPEIMYLGEGSANFHFRIGQIDGIWLATREMRDFVSEIDSLQKYRDYVNCTVSTQRAGMRTLSVCGGVNCEFRASRKNFLLVEDLTAGGTASLEPARMGEVAGYVNGELVYYDFSFYSHEGISFEYMSRDKVLSLTR